MKIYYKRPDNMSPIGAKRRLMTCASSSELHIIKKLFTAFAVICMMLMVGCGQAEEQNDDDKPYIAVICKGAQHEFWKTVEQGAMDAGEEMDIRVTFEAPEDESQIDVQIEMMKKVIEEGADAIVLAPLDTERLNGVVEEAVSRGIPVLTLDSDITTSARVATIGTSNESAGAIAARNAADLMGGRGKVAIIVHVQNALTAIEKTRGFVDEIDSKYKGKIKIMDTTSCNGDPEIAKEQALDFLDKYPDLDCFYGTNEGAAVGIAAAVKERNLQGKILIIGFDSSDDEIAYLSEGIINGMMVQNPYNMGYLGVRNLKKVLDGKTIEQKIDTGVTYVNGDNLYDEDTQWLLYPLGKKSK
ncbi:MAG: substrate-binding domain-containing protein [Lachnospiraceae bacterium]|nr:substrate-binding domain-containing protein [Lachnospiraceae bacterium]